jgi:4-hydroxy-tetrahydrodipicolinate reductase
MARWAGRSRRKPSCGGIAIVSRIVRQEAAHAIGSLGPENTDVVVEFTHPDQALGNFDLLLDRGLPIVTGTTGWMAELDKVKKMVHQRNGALVYSSNFSPGVNVLFRLNQILAELMNKQEGYDVYVEEAHHRNKKDAPSGTALTLVDGLLASLDEKSKWEYAGFGQRPPEVDEISVAVTRAGDIVGKHAVVYRSAIDEIRISHEAYNRRGFALGAVLGAEWIAGKKGLFNFAEVFK